MSVPKNIISVIEPLFTMWSSCFLGGNCINSLEAGSNVNAVNGKISANKSIDRIWMAKIGTGQSNRAPKIKPIKTNDNSAILEVKEAMIVFFKLL